jgi:hypothetical protein
MHETRDTKTEHQKRDQPSGDSGKLKHIIIYKIILPSLLYIGGIAFSTNINAHVLGS